MNERFFLTQIPCRWSFGGNRLQIKAEEKILGDVVSALAGVAGIACHTQGPHKSLQSKQDLLQILIENERSRLKVWLFPLEPERKHYMSGGKNYLEVRHLRLSFFCTCPYDFFFVLI